MKSLCVTQISAFWQTHRAMYIHHHNHETEKSQSPPDFLTLPLLVSPAQYPGNPSSVLHASRFAFSRKSYKWNHAAWTLLRSTAFPQHNAFAIQPGCWCVSTLFLSPGCVVFHHIGLQQLKDNWVVSVAFCWWEIKNNCHKYLWMGFMST